VIGGLYWKRANTLGAYLALLMVRRRDHSLLLLHWNENITASPHLAWPPSALSLGSLIGSALPHPQLRQV